MNIGVPREIKPGEQRVALTPAGARALTETGPRVVVEQGAGAGSGIRDEEYTAVGAGLAAVDEVWRRADLVLKVKEPLAPEVARLRDGQVLFTYLHLAPAPELTRGLLATGAIAVAYETVQRPDGSLPLLTPMSEIAGRLAVQAGARHLEKPHGGRGVLLGGVAGVAPGSVVVIGGGIVGTNAAVVAAGMQAHVAVLDTDLGRLRELELMLAGRMTLLHSTRLAIEELLPTADLVVGAVLVPGARAPTLIPRASLRLMRPGSVIVDVAVDQGGCVETSRPTTHSDPVYEVDGVVHYGVANMPGAVPVTATRALGNATLPYVLRIADEGLDAALAADPGLEAGVNVRHGAIVNPTVAEALAP